MSGAIIENQFRYDMLGVFYGTSKSVKPRDVKNGSTFLETDTGTQYKFIDGEWIPV